MSETLSPQKSSPDHTKIEQAKRIIGERVELFARNLGQYRQLDYKEAQLRREFLDPFFSALGWDVSNAQGWAEQYKEVVNEDALKIGEATKAPDYSFRIGGMRKFFAEAKKPSLTVKTDMEAAYQLRRYAWSAKLPLSILSDFEELAIYDCRARPSPKDKASVGRVNFLTYDQYLDRLPEIYDVFSKEAVLRGSFDRYAQAGGRGTTRVDAEFLKEIEDWRASLAKNIADLNRRLSLDELNDAVQRTIDRIIFLRMAEDRGAEPYGELLALTKRGGIYRELMKLCRDADDKYNSGLFDFQADQLTPNLKIDDDKLGKILADLYYPQSPYEFSLLAEDTLGNVYEQFLGKVIRLTPSHQARIEEKPEVKKAGGVHYTPSYIGQYLAAQTLGKMIEGKSPREIAQMRVLDMACGSGTLLLCAYQLLLDYYLNWHVNHRAEKQSRNTIYESATGWRLTTAEKKRILLAHIFGVDIDRQAVEVTKLSLLLKVLEGENQETLGKQLALFKERALPNLDANIKCGNSLIGPDYFAGQMFSDAEESRRVNPFDWAREFPEIFHREGAKNAKEEQGFDCVIGNPPYVRMEIFKSIKDYLKANYQSHDERSDMYAYFIERAHQLLNARGRFGMIVSNKFVRANYGKPLREFLNRNANVEQIVDFAGLPVFEGATVRTIVIITSRGMNNQAQTLYSPPLPLSKFDAIVSKSLSVEEAIAQSTYEISSNALGQSVWSFAKHDAYELITRLGSTQTSLGKYCDGQIGYGIKSGLEEAFVIDAKIRKEILDQNPKATEIIKSYLNGRDVRRYSIDFQEVYIIYTWHGIEMENYPAVIKYLKPFKDRLQKRATKQEWYELQQPQFNYAPYFDNAKIIFPDIAVGPRFALDEVGYYGSTTTFFIPRRDLYLIGLLNSRLGYFYFAETCAALEGKIDRYLRFKRQYVENFPVRTINFSDAADKAPHERVVALVEQMLGLQKQLHTAKTQADRELFQRQIDATDAEIDGLVYELYGLTEEEIRIVEGVNG